MWCPNQFYICSNCESCHTCCEKILKLIYYPLCVLSGGRSCVLSGIDNCSLFTFNHINNTLNNPAVKIHPKIMLTCSNFNPLQQTDLNSSFFHDIISNIVTISAQRPENVLFLCNLQQKYSQYIDSHQICVAIKNDILYILDNDKQSKHELGKYMQQWRQALTDNHWQKIKIEYRAFDFNCYATYIQNEKDWKCFASGFCIPNSCYCAILFAMFYDSFDVFEQLYQHCKYIKLLFNDKLVSYFPHTHFTTFPVWHISYRYQWTNYWKMLNKSMTRKEYVHKHKRMFLYNI